jgi:hypothetical protein
VTKDVEVSIPAVSFSLSVNLDGTKENYNNLVVQFHLPFTFEEKEINIYVDKVFSVIERRKLRYKLEQLVRSLEEHEAFIPNAKNDLTKLHNQNHESWLASGRKGVYKPSKSEAQQIQLAKNNIQNTEIVIKRIKTQIQVTEKKLGLTSAANSNVS